MSNPHPLPVISGSLATFDEAPDQATDRNDRENESVGEGPYLFLYNPDDMLRRYPLRDDPLSTDHQPEVSNSNPVIHGTHTQQTHTTTDGVASNANHPSTQATQLNIQMLDSLFDGVYSEVFQRARGNLSHHSNSEHNVSSTSVPHQKADTLQAESSIGVQYAFTPGLQGDEIRIRPQGSKKDDGALVISDVPQNREL
ncbi:hypothetical protein BJ165DRAFT_1494552 [Panaeolus papilionaceus]|nr:hypothetical protein BJ165DRAFT_1494552 [Panaeolus papilionaceus]